MNTVIITPFANATHREQVIALWKSVFGYEAAHNDPGLVINKKIAADNDLFFVAVVDHAVVGTVMAGYDGHRGWIYSVAVAPTHRRKRIGSRLVAHAERVLIGKGCVKINLQIAEGNEKVAEFYLALGFSVEKRVSMGKRIPANVPAS
jgi:ribosomal protein S18 acetylase RimI-like enzyme